MPLPRTLLRDQPFADTDLEVTQGVWPAGLTGELVISAPHPDTFWGPHPFFGDGVTHRLSLQPGTFGAPADRHAWRSRRVDTPSSRLRQARPDAFRPTMIGVQSPYGVSNAANTAPLVWGDRLFTTWDVGRPVEIDPVTLGFLGEVGHRDEWMPFEVTPQPVLPLVMTTAHPVIDHDRDVLWTVNTVWGQLHVVRWDGEGPLAMWPIEGGVIPQSVHTITQTRDWLIIGDCAYKVEPQVLHGGERTEPANHSGPLYLIRKEALEAVAPGTPVAATCLEVAPEINHYYAFGDDSDGRVRILFEHTENAELSMAQRTDDIDALGRPSDPALRGLYGFGMSPDRATVMEIDAASGKVTDAVEQRDPSLLWGRQLNAMDWSPAGRAAPSVHHTVHHGWRPEGITQRMLRLYGDRVDRTEWPAEETPPVVVTSSLPDLEIRAVHPLAMDDMPTSPIFVPRDPGAGGRDDQGSDPGGHDGWVVVPILSDAGFRVEAYDAAAVDRGPVATLSAPGATMPFILHAAWLPAARPSEPRPRTRFATELDRLDELPDDLAAAARQVAAELDEGAPAE